MYIFGYFKIFSRGDKFCKWQKVQSRAEQSTRSRYVTYRDSARLQRADWSTLWANLAMGYDKFVYKGNSLISIFSMFQFPNPSLESVSK